MNKPLTLTPQLVYIHRQLTNQQISKRKHPEQQGPRNS